MTTAWPAALVALVSLACVQTKEARRGGDDLYAPSRAAPSDEPGAVTTPTKVSESEIALPAPVARWSELTKQLGHDLRRVGGSCAQVARVMNNFVKTHGQEYGALQQEVVRWEKRSLKRDVDRFYRRTSLDLDARIDAGIRCKDDAAARAAYDAFFRVAGLDTR
ncbi:MAG: hypothetical protein IT385_20115 [Deltaproteobacteria bacterium]|nr:hypothetical protein [Deltaproteobacteria bacterium]